MCVLSRSCTLVFTLGLLVMIAWFIILHLIIRQSPNYNLVSDPEAIKGNNNATTQYNWPVFVTARKLIEMQEAEEFPLGVTVLDARPKPNAFTRFGPAGTSVHGSARAYWTDFAANGGILKSDEQLATLFEQRGVSPGRPVVVYGAWTEGWGEEGRVYWQLAYLGHVNVSILYGGIYAWNEHCRDHGGDCGRFASSSDEKKKIADPAGKFVAKANNTLRVSFNDVVWLDEMQSNDTRAVIMDARNGNEYDGATPYGSTYGGHIPRALSFPWKSVFDSDGSGNIASPEAIWTAIRSSPGAPSNLPPTFANLTQAARTTRYIAVSYCTGGVRSAFLFATLTWMPWPGIVSNYDGSWWEYSKQSFTGGS